MPLLALVLALAAPPNLSKLVLKPAQVGAGYVLVQRSDGRGTAQRTLDLCGTKNYPSEALRAARLQVNYLKNGSKYALSNEVVAYKSGGAAQAMREVAQHADHCPTKPFATEGQPPLSYRITRLQDSKLLKGYVAVQIHVTGTLKGKKVDSTSYAVYQRVGDVLSGVYSYALPGASNAVQEQFCLHAAEASALDLRTGGSGGGLPA